jgi:hypothetical protein
MHKFRKKYEESKCEKNGHCQEIIDILMFDDIIKHLVKAEFVIFVQLILSQVFCNS